MSFGLVKKDIAYTNGSFQRGVLDLGTADKLSVNTVNASLGYLINNSLLLVGVSSFADLPDQAPGLRAFVNNSAVTAAGNFGSLITSGGGTNLVPVYSDGTNWRIG